jgi:hypothetical protein
MRGVAHSAAAVTSHLRMKFSFSGTVVGFVTQGSSFRISHLNAGERENNNNYKPSKKYIVKLGTANAVPITTVRLMGRLGEQSRFL